MCLTEVQFSTLYVILSIALFNVAQKQIKIETKQKNIESLHT